MKFAIVLATACLALAAATLPGSANEAGTSSKATASVAVETGYVTTQGRRGGGSFRGGGGGGRSFGGGGRGRNFGRNVGIGVGAAVLGGIIANEAYRSRGGGNCRSWSYQCNNGSGYACRNFDRYC